MMATVEKSLIDRQQDTEFDLIARLITSADEARSSCAWFNSSLFFDKRLGDIWDKVIGGDDPIYVIYQLESERAAELLQRSNDLPYTTRLEALVQIIRDCNALRRAESQAQKIMGKIVEFDVAGVQLEIDALSEESIAVGNKKPGRTIEEVGESFKERAGNPQTAIRTGIRLLDDVIGGQFAGELTTFATRPGTGKTALALAISKRVARERRVNLFSLEMEAEQLMARMACPRAGLLWSDVRLGKITPEQKARLDEATDEIVIEMKRSNMVILDAPNDHIYTVMDIHRACVIRKPEYVVIDLLGLIQWHETRVDEVKWYGRAVRYLKQRIAFDLGVPVLLLHHVNRAPDARQDKRPTLSDLKQSGDIEGYSDVVWLAYREDAYSGRSPGQIDVPFELSVAKNRQGFDCNKIILNYNLREQDFN